MSNQCKDWSNERTVDPISYHFVHSLEIELTIGYGNVRIVEYRDSDQPDTLRQRLLYIAKLFYSLYRLPANCVEMY